MWFDDSDEEATIIEAKSFVDLAREFQHSVASAIEMPKAAQKKPEMPIASVDSSHLLEGECQDAEVDEEIIATSFPTAPVHQTNVRRLARPTSPQKPPSSIVGGCGLPNLATIWTSDSPAIVILQTVDFTVVKKGIESHLRFLVTHRPSGLEPLLTQEDWDVLRSRFDELGMRIRWDVYRSLILLVLLFVMIVIINSGDEIGGPFSLGDTQMSVLIVMGVILLKLFWDECYENYARRAVFHEVDTACKEFSEMMRPRGACLAFRFADNDEFGLLADLVFYRVEMTTEDMTMRT